MLIRPFLQHDLARLIDLTIETFRPFYEDSFRPLVGDVIFTNQHGNWRDDYRRTVPELHDPDQHKYVAVAELGGAVGAFVAWNIDPPRRGGSITHLAVSVEHRRHHVGTALCEHAFAEMRTLGADVATIGTGGDPFHAPCQSPVRKPGVRPAAGRRLLPTADQ
jgi:ribosomal protein S18 acetylase RimI-like enzyme